MFNSTRIEFKTADGTTLRGDYFQAEGKERPVVIMTAGFPLLKEHYISAIASRYQQAGISALAFDYRNYGSSDGLPRHDTNFQRQAEDYQDAISAAMRLPGVNSKRVALYGVGHAGASTIIAAASDRRLAAVVLQSPVISGQNDAVLFRQEMIDLALRDREERLLTGDGKVNYVKAFPETVEEAADKDAKILIGGEGPYNFMQEALKASEKAQTPFENRVTLRSVLNITKTEARDYLHRIKVPVFYTAMPEDPFTGNVELHRDAVATMGSNVEFSVIEPEWQGSFEAFVLWPIKDQIDFLTRVL